MLRVKLQAGTKQKSLDEFPVRDNAWVGRIGRGDTETLLLCGGGKHVEQGYQASLPIVPLLWRRNQPQNPVVGSSAGPGSVSDAALRSVRRLAMISRATQIDGRCTNAASANYTHFCFATSGARMPESASLACFQLILLRLAFARPLPGIEK